MTAPKEILLLVMAERSFVHVPQPSEWKPALFSANCNGASVIYTDLAMMAGFATTGEEGEGKRFQASVLDYHLGGRLIFEGTPADLVAARSTLTAKHLATYAGP